MIQTRYTNSLYGIRILFLFMVLLQGVSGADSPPSWLDTVPPAVVAEPSQRWHNEIFHVKLRADEQADLWIARNNVSKMKKYRRPIVVARDGVYRFYFRGEDDFGNRSSIDSIEYVLDTRAPVIRVSPVPGVYTPHTVIRVTTDESAQLYHTKTKTDPLIKKVTDSLFLDELIHGYFVAVDSAGNRGWSDSCWFIPDTAGFSISVDLPEGIYNVRKRVSITVPKGLKAFYTFDPLAPPEWFTEYSQPFNLPHGLTIMRYFGKSPAGVESDIRKKSYIIDTIPPRVQVRVAKGEAADTVRLVCKEKADILFTTDGSIPNEDSKKYRVPLVVLHEGISRIKAKARDRAGNVSNVVTWEYKYDYVPPQVEADPSGGIYTRSISVELKANEDARFIYSLDTADTVLPLVYTPGSLLFTRQGNVVLRYQGIDAADNVSEIKTVRYKIDSRPPDIQAVIQADIAENRYQVTLQCGEPKVKIHYSINGDTVTGGSSLYTTPVVLSSGDVLLYRGIDSVGNISPVEKLDELTRPLVEAHPAPGMYNRRIRIRFDTNRKGTIWWRILPDTLFREVTDSLILEREGEHSFEYFLLTEKGLRSAIRRNVYYLDWTSPDIALKVQKGVGDSAVIFFDASENASIYYTTDGSNPLYSATAHTAGNRFQRSADRITLKRDIETRLAYYAEDAAGNQSALTILDVFRPHVIPNIPAGSDRIHDRILSITLQSQEGSIIHYLRHGKKPTVQSPIYSEPINLSSSDTIVAFVVDGTGYQGEPETFIYRIDLPPSPQFSISPDTVYSGTTVRYNAKGTLDRESTFENIRFRWDFDGDGTFDTDTGFLPEVTHSFKTPGKYRSILEVIDESARSAQFERDVEIRKRCQSDMVAVFDSRGAAFCIDTYEWPNRAGAAPLVNVSWVEAKMNCIDAGKRLCTEDEWVSACNNNARSMYPYGDNYDEKRCATEGKNVASAGSHPECSSAGVHDMVGNVWEWVEEKRDDLTQAYGGSYKYGKDAYCGLRFEGTVASRSEETGFRCCK